MTTPQHPKAVEEYSHDLGMSEVSLKHVSDNIISIEKFCNEEIQLPDNKRLNANYAQTLHMSDVQLECNEAFRKSTS